MKKILIILTLLIMGANAHTLLLEVINNEDNTITIEGAFSTGEPADGALVKLKSLVSGKILYKKRLPLESFIVVNIPKEPYQVILDGGPGHIYTKDGIAPKEGYSQNLVNEINNSFQEGMSKKTDNNILTFIYFLIVVLVLLAIFFSFYNTNRLLKQIKESNSNNHV